MTLAHTLCWLWWGVRQREFGTYGTVGGAVDDEGDDLRRFGRDELAGPEVSAFAQESFRALGLI